MNLYLLGTALSLATVYMLGGLGNVFLQKCGQTNLGGEVQIYAGGFTCAVILIKFNYVQSSSVFFLALFLALFCAALVSALISFLSAVLLYYRKCDFLFTSFIVSSALIPFIDSLISGPFRVQKGSLLATDQISQIFIFKSIFPPSTLNVSFIIAILLCIASFYILYRTTFGRQTCIFGVSPEFAKCSGYNSKKIIYTNTILCGTLHGIAGAVAICGIYFTCHQGFYTGIGWACLSCALLSASNPLILIASSILFAILTTYTNNFALFHNFNFDTGSLIQAIALFIVSFTFYRRTQK